MPRDKVRWGNFCRRWKISYAGDDKWSGRVVLGDRFVIVRNKKVHRFIPLQGFRGGIQEDGMGRNEDLYYEHGDTVTLKGALILPIGETSIVFLLLPAGDTFEILLGEIPTVQLAGMALVPPMFVHGGPHGSDD